MNFDASIFGKVAVLMGGVSPEHNISLLSGQAVLHALEASGIDAFGLVVDQDFCRIVSQTKFDRAFIALHGVGGEDGMIQGILDSLNIPYTGSGLLASALALDKIQTKRVWQALGFPILNHIELNNDKTAAEVISELGLPLAIKPVNQGSSLGVTRVDCKETFREAYSTALDFHAPVIAEPWVEGRELTVGILEDIALPIIEIKTPEGFYDYKAKYFSKKTEYICPADLDMSLATAIKDISEQAYHALRCRHWGRVDLVQNNTGDFYLLEVNTIPGLTETSLVPKAAAEIGIDFEELIIKILRQTLNIF